ncbi:hypothetical protein EOI86_12865 [Hwanghaeella grinnelliae]|uniref:Uncharacterized protein n=1 Tax=Hwanghaeella grinnelliae TaxID=2500179 RepID=A0A3S2VPT2_9PROT|nr:hypothetical protein [Hwanghaeella grinnelliae]RVU36115.1 hypothetical protein EOI86_12865 [Hwanghaeella grinnelliae]
MSISSVSSSVSSARADIPLSAAQRNALNSLKQVEGALAVTTQRLATNNTGPGQLVNILT